MMPIMVTQHPQRSVFFHFALTISISGSVICFLLLQYSAGNWYIIAPTAGTRRNSSVLQLCYLYRATSYAFVLSGMVGVPPSFTATVCCSVALGE